MAWLQDTQDTIEGTLAPEDRPVGGWMGGQGPRRAAEDALDRTYGESEEDHFAKETAQNKMRSGLEDARLLEERQRSTREADAARRRAASRVGLNKGAAQKAYTEVDRDLQSAYALQMVRAQERQVGRQAEGLREMQAAENRAREKRMAMEAELQTRKQTAEAMEPTWLEKGADAWLNYGNPVGLWYNFVGKPAYDWITEE